MSGECAQCGEHCLNCNCLPSPWPPNWREIMQKMPKCDRCGNLGRMYVLCELYPDVSVCLSCRSEYKKIVAQFLGKINDANCDE